MNRYDASMRPMSPTARSRAGISDASEASSTEMSAMLRAMSLASDSAIETSAAARAGESLMPSPTIATTCPWRLISST
jgi:hypothetical protein